MRMNRRMRTLVETLFTAQQKLRTTPALADRQEQFEHLRADIPAPILAHFLRLIEQGRKAVALVQHGVCSSCHLRIPSGIAAALARPNDLHLCENCGAYLLLPASEQPHAAPRAHPVARRSRKALAA